MNANIDSALCRTINKNMTACMDTPFHHHKLNFLSTHTQGHYFASSFSNAGNSWKSSHRITLSAIQLNGFLHESSNRSKKFKIHLFSICKRNETNNIFTLDTTAICTFCTYMNISCPFPKNSTALSNCWIHSEYFRWT